MLVMMSADGRPLLRADTRELQAAGSGRGRGRGRGGCMEEVSITQIRRL